MYHVCFKILLFCFLFLVVKSVSSQEKFIDPTGVYSFDAKTYKKNGDTYGYFGTIKVLLLDSKKVLINFFICKGAPSYNSGSFIDSFVYKNNQSIYFGDSTSDSTCKMKFSFDKKGVHIDMFSKNINFACGFGHAVDAQGYYRKLLRRRPTKKEVLTDSE